QKMTEQPIKCPFSCWRKPVASILPTVTTPVSSEQSATIATPEQDIIPTAIESPEEDAAPATAATSDDKVDASATRKKFRRRLLENFRLPGLRDTPTSTPSTEEVGAGLTLDELWKKLLKNGLKKEKSGRLSDLLKYKSCKDDILKLYKAYEERADTKFLTAMKPVVEGLLAFSPGITSLAKANKLLPLVWGSIQIFLESAKSIYSVSSSIQALLDSLETMLPRLKEYVNLYPDNERLRKISCDVYVVYVDACIQTALYLERRACTFALLTSLKENLLRELCLACRDGRRFADAIDKLEKHERAFHHEADLASARHVKDIHTAVSERAPDLMAPANSQSSIREQHT
ncbi:hypothetical protein N5P37_007923, partial [Trichoderma harzianum]